MRHEPLRKSSDESCVALCGLDERAACKFWMPQLSADAIYEKGWRIRRARLSPGVGRFVSLAWGRAHRQPFS